MIKRITSISVLVLLITAGCSKVIPNLYHSEADIPYKSRTTFTEFYLVEGQKLYEGKRNYGVIVAVDNKNIKYMLIAPTKGSAIGVKDLKSLNLSRAVTLPQAEIQLLYNSVSVAFKMWDRDFAERQGINIEYMLAPENQIYRVSQNVVEWYPTIKFNMQNHSDGPLGYLILGEGLASYVYSFNKKADVLDFQTLLDNALKRF